MIFDILVGAVVIGAIFMVAVNVSLINRIK